MKMMAEVTVEMSANEADGSEPDISEDNTVVGDVLAAEEDHEAKENWKRLVRKLSDKRRKSIKKKKEMELPEQDHENVFEMEVEASEEEDDDIPDDWMPDLKPNYFNIPDVVPKSAMELSSTFKNKFDCVPTISPIYAKIF